MQLSVKLHFLTSCLTASNHVILWVNIAAARIYVSVRVATPGACQTITLVHQSAMMSSDLVHLVSPWQTCSCGWLLAPPSLWFLFSSLSQNITGHNNNNNNNIAGNSSFYFREKFLRLKVDMHKTVFRDQLTNVDQDKSSSVSGDFENVFPCKEQIEHFLTASRELRKSRENNKYYYSHICLDFFSNKVQKTSSYPHNTALGERLIVDFQFRTNSCENVLEKQRVKEGESLSC